MADDLLGVVLTEAGRLVVEAEEPVALLQSVCAMLAERVPHYDWVGYYLVDPASPRELVLGPYVGAPTDHTRIPFGRGICGQAAATGETFLIQDVSKEDNYLSCSATVQSEIVVPVFLADAVVGELDIDSHALAPFTARDREVLERVAELTAPACDAARRAL
jgi:L-methionine (R)-S-oxide reductase